MTVWSASTRDAAGVRSGAVALLGGSDFTVRFNGVGSWSLTAPWSEGLWSRLEPGGGVILRPRGSVVSGPIVSYGYDETLDEATGRLSTVIVVEGVTDEVVLADSIVYPDPARAGTEQTTQTHWTAQRDAGGAPVSVPAETALLRLVDQQVGPAARPERQAVGLSVAADLGRGPLVRPLIRYGAPNLLAELQTIARAAGLGFRVVSTGGSGRRFEVFEPSDRAGDVRYGASMGNVAGQSFRTGAPSATYALAGGKGEGVARLQRDYTATDPAATGWRRRIESYVDARDTDDVTELAERTRQTVEDGAPELTFGFTPVDTPNARLLKHVGLGDRVTVYAGPQGARRVARFVDVVREIHGELTGDTDVLRAAVGSEGASTGVPLPSMRLLLKLRADLQALKGSA